MTRVLLNIFFIAFVVGLLALAVWWQRYQYKDCKNVGHSTLYCVMKIGK